MKLRSSFVSNSSSSSYIIAYNSSDFGDNRACECCGFPYLEPLELIRSRQNNYSETDVYWADADDKIESLKGNADAIKVEINQIKRECPNKVLIAKSFQFQYEKTVYDDLKYKVEGLAEKEYMINIISEARDKYDQVAEISLSNHDDFLRKLLNAYHKKQLVQIVSGEYSDFLQTG